MRFCEYYAPGESVDLIAEFPYKYGDILLFNTNHDRFIRDNNYYYYTGVCLADVVNENEIFSVGLQGIFEFPRSSFRPDCDDQIVNGTLIGFVPNEDYDGVIDTRIGDLDLYAEGNEHIFMLGIAVSRLNLQTAKITDTCLIRLFGAYFTW